MDHESSSRDLADRSSSGDATALEELLHRHLPGLYAYVRLRSGRTLLAKESQADLVQSVCREILEDLDRFPFESEGLFRHWLYQTAERKILDRARYWRRAKRDVEREAPPPSWTQSGLGWMAGIAGGGASPSEHAMAREEVARLEEAFQALPESHQEIIVLSRIVGLTSAEIGARLGRSEGSVRVLLSRALARLSALLNAAG